MVVLSLEDASLTKIVTSICVAVLQKESTEELYGYVLVLNVFPNFSAEVEKAILALDFPHQLNQKLEVFASMICEEVHAYISYVSPVIGVKHYRNILSSMSFAMDGKIDYELTSHQLVEDIQIDVDLRIVLACELCLEGKVLQFWKIKPDGFQEEIHPEYCPTELWRNYLEQTAPDRVEMFLWEDWYMLEPAFISSVRKGHFMAVKYYCEKITKHHDVLIEYKFHMFRLGNNILTARYKFQAHGVFIFNKIKSFLEPLFQEITTEMQRQGMLEF